MVILTTMCFVEVIRTVIDTGITRLQRRVKLSNHRQVINLKLHLASKTYQIISSDKVGPVN